MASLRSNIRSLRNQVKGNYISLKLMDGSTVQFPEDSWAENFRVNCARLNAHYRGEPVPDPHPFGVALTKARNLGPDLAREADKQVLLDNQVSKGRLHMG